ncbi:hypothetical protein ACVWW3_007759 [Bradyrhizobium sp. LM2.9]
MEDDKTRSLAEKVPTLALNDPDPARGSRTGPKEYEKLCPGPGLQTR